MTELAGGFSRILREIQEAAQALSSSNDYTKIRAAVNLKQSRVLLDNSRAKGGDRVQNGTAAHKLEQANERLLERAEQQVQEQLAAPQAAEIDNRTRLNDYFSQQGIEPPRTSSPIWATDFEDGAARRGPGKIGLQSLLVRAKQTARPRGRRGKQGPDRRCGRQPAGQAGKPAASRYLRGSLAETDEKAKLQRDQQSGQKAPAIAGKQDFDQLQKKLLEEEAGRQLGRRAGGRANRRAAAVRTKPFAEPELRRPGQQAASESAGGQPQLRRATAVCRAAAAAAWGAWGAACSASIARSRPANRCPMPPPVNPPARHRPIDKPPTNQFPPSAWHSANRRRAARSSRRRPGQPRRAASRARPPVSLHHSPRRHRPRRPRRPARRALAAHRLGRSLPRYLPRLALQPSVVALALDATGRLLRFRRRPRGPRPHQPRWQSAARRRLAARGTRPLPRDPLAFPARAATQAAI